MACFTQHSGAVRHRVVLGHCVHIIVIAAHRCDWWWRFRTRISCIKACEEQPWWVKAATGCRQMCLQLQGEQGLWAPGQSEAAVRELARLGVHCAPQQPGAVSSRRALCSSTGVEWWIARLNSTPRLCYFNDWFEQLDVTSALQLRKRSNDHCGFTLCVKALHGSDITQMFEGSSYICLPKYCDVPSSVTPSCVTGWSGKSLSLRNTVGEPVAQGWCKRTSGNVKFSCVSGSVWVFAARVHFEFNHTGVKHPAFKEKKSVLTARSLVKGKHSSCVCIWPSGFLVLCVDLIDF